MTPVILFNQEDFIEGENLSDRLGVRGSSIMGLAALSLPLAPGFIYESSQIKDLNTKMIVEGVTFGIASIEDKTDKVFGSEEFPLTLKVVLAPSIHLSSIRSVHNVGLNDKTTEGFSRFCGEDFAYGEYKYFIEQFSLRFLSYDKDVFEDAAKQIKNLSKKKICGYYLTNLIDNFPQSPVEQLKIILEELKKQHYEDSLNQGIDAAILVQMMTYGNLGSDSYNGSYYSREIFTGKPGISGYFGRNQFYTERERGFPITEIDPSYLKEFEQIATILEKSFLEIRKIKFTIEEGKIWLVDQNQVEQKSSCAELRTLLDLVKSKVVSDTYLIKNFLPRQLNDLLHPLVDKAATCDAAKIIGGIGGSPGAAQGKVIFSTKKLLEAYQDSIVKGEKPKYILAMKSLYAEDVQAIEIGEAVISSEGGYASHAPVVARSLGKPAIVNPNIEFYKGYMVIDGVKIQEGEFISLEVPTYEEPTIYLGEVKLVYPDIAENGLQEFIEHVRKHIGAFKIRTNADNPHDAKLAKKLGATGIGLCRTEHMFFDPDRIMIFRELILASSKEERLVALEKLKPFQKEDFKKLFEVMEGEGVTIRLLDAPLHEFLPVNQDGLQETLNHFKSIKSLCSKDEILRRFDRLKEINPMLGHRGCRIGISYPEIYEMQVAAILEAAYEVKTELKTNCNPEIMVPIVMKDEEIKFIKNGKNIEGTKVKGIAGVVEELLKSLKISEFPFVYKVGTMIELPSAALSAGHIAKQAEFFSFGTNDLTQTTHGLSRDDINSFLPSYTHYDILQDNPFQILTNPVKELITIATQTGRLTRPDLKIGLCGEHATNPNNIEYCIEAGLNYVSCSPYGVPLATLAVAQHNLSTYISGLNY